MFDESVQIRHGCVDVIPNTLVTLSRNVAAYTKLAAESGFSVLDPWGARTQQNVYLSIAQWRHMN